MNSAALGILALLSFVAVDVSGLSDKADFALHPADSQLALLPGEQGVVILYVESASSTHQPIDLVATPVDWCLDSDGVIRYSDVGSTANSASSWVLASPNLLTLTPGGMARIRLTVKVPRTAKAGIYRAGVFIAHNDRTLHPTDVFRVTVRVWQPSSHPAP